MSQFFKKVLVAISGSESSINGAKYAIVLSKTYNIELSAVYVIDTSTLKELLLSKIFIDDELKNYEENLELNGKKYLEYVEALAKNKGVKLNKIIKKGSITTMILEAADEIDADIIVLGGWEENRSKRDLFSRAHLDLLIDSKRTVIIVKNEDIEEIFKMF